MVRRKRKSSDDIERRLDRLEKLLTRQNRRRRVSSVSTSDGESPSDDRSSHSPYEHRRRSRHRNVSRNKRSRRLSSSSSQTSSGREVHSTERGEAHTMESLPTIEAALPEEVAGTSTLPADIEGLLGMEGAPKISNATDLHESLATRWSAILQHGLKEETIQSLIKKYDSPKNCSFLGPPKLNEEVAAAAMNESGIKRDKRIADQQTILSAAISAVGRVLGPMIIIEGNTLDIEMLSDSARLLCELYQTNSETRRSLILPGLNKEVKETLTQSPVSEYLFGDKLQDKVAGPTGSSHVPVAENLY